MQVHVHFIYHEEARGKASGIFTKMGIESNASVSDVANERNHIPYPIAEK
jgi:hypothetical protein